MRLQFDLKWKVRVLVVMKRVTGLILLKFLSNQVAEIQVVLQTLLKNLEYLFLKKQLLCFLVELLNFELNFLIYELLKNLSENYRSLSKQIAMQNLVLIYQLNLMLQVDFVQRNLYRSGFLDSHPQNPMNNMFELNIFFAQYFIRYSIRSSSVVAI